VEELIQDILSRVAPIPAYDRVTIAAAILATAVGDERLTAHRRDIAHGQVCVAVALGESVARGLAGAVETMRGGGEEFPKLDHLSFWWTFDGQGRRLFRCTYKVPGYKRRTDRLGRDGKKAYKRAQFISETLSSVAARLLKAEEAHRLLYVDRSPIDQHVAAFEKSLKTRNVNDDYRKSTVFRIRDCLKVGDVSRVDQITLAKVGEILQSLRARGEREGEVKLAAQTINQYLRAMKQFVRWMKKTGRIVHNPIEDAEGVKETDDDGRRRDASREELAEIYAAAMRDEGKHARAMRGPDRGMLYLTAWCTGLRRKELRAMSIDWIEFDAAEPHVKLPKKYAKGKKRALIPLPKWLASALKSWLGDRTSGPVFHTMPEQVAPAFDRDREAARKAWLDPVTGPGEKELSVKERRAREDSDFLKRETSDGTLVFHSLRHGYGSELLESGADAKLVQHLMRHSTITLTFDRYGHVRAGRAATAVENAFTDPRPANPSGEAGGNS
jgi:integrase